MQLVTMRIGGKATAGFVVGAEALALRLCGGVLPAAAAMPTSVRGILDQPDGVDGLRRLLDAVHGSPDLQARLRNVGALIPLAAAELLAPVPDPSFILSCGANYRAHLHEMNSPVPETPVAFAKSPASIIGPKAAIEIPPSHPRMVDWEGEFCAVIGRDCHRVSAADALDYVAGYTLINDVSARDWVAPLFSASGFMGQIQAWEHNLLGKMFPTFCPMGPTLTTRDEIPDPADVDLATRLNGEVMQSANTSDLVFGVADLIAYYSQFYRFRPGDIITTGSPAGVGYGRKPQVFMKPGDLVDVASPRIGTLSSPVVLGEPK